MYDAIVVGGGPAARVPDGEPLPRRALFFKTGVAQRSELAAKLGCAFTKKGVVRAARHRRGGGRHERLRRQ